MSGELHLKDFFFSSLWCSLTKFQGGAICHGTVPLKLTGGQCIPNTAAAVLSEIIEFLFCPLGL